MEYILKIENIVKSFSENLSKPDSNKAILSEINMEITPLSTIAIIGGNGAGKTTLLNIINGFIKPDSGSITLNNSGKLWNLVHLYPHETARLGIGRLFQGTRVYGNLTVMENLMIACNEYSLEQPFYNVLKSRKYKKQLAEIVNKIETILHNIEGNGFLNDINKKAGDLAYGQQRMLNLISLLLGDYKIVLLDEPTSGINPEDWVTIESIILAMKNSGITIVMVEHNIDFVKKHASDCFYMKAGSIVVSGNTNHVLNHSLVKNDQLELC